MKLSTTWIKKSLRRTISDKSLGDALENSGIEVEQLLSSKPIDPLIIAGLIKKVVQHPNADKLKLTQIELPDRVLSIVCGAPNVREGMKVAVAQIGTTLPEGDVIAKTKLRGEVSEGMLCSEKELGLGDSHDGILELDLEIPVGTKLCDLYPADGEVDVKTPANRPDLLSIIGIAREVAAFSDNELKTDTVELLNLDATDIVAFEVEPAVTSSFALAEIKLGKSNSYSSGDTMPEYVAWLRTSGVRSISPIVDITNAVMLQYGQPLHAYDADKVNGVVTVRFAEPKETLVTLDGVERQLTEVDLVIADDTGPIGLAGVMGGATTEVGPETTRIYLESAIFDGATVRKMAKRHGLRSEASARYERGLPAYSAELGLAMAVKMIHDRLGGHLVKGTNAVRAWPWVQRIGLKSSQLSRLLGFELSSIDAVSLLGRIGIEAKTFDIGAEARSHLGKPYVWGAKFRTHGTEAFDCSYLPDYLYSLIGLKVGHTAKELFDSGSPVEISELEPGDLLFRGGPWKKLDASERGGVSHCAIYIGDGRIVEAANYHRVDGEWVEMDADQQRVIESDLTTITEDEQYMGARRYAEDLEDYISVSRVPWWRPDLKLPEDLIEEIVRLLGYDKIPATLPIWRPRNIEFDRERQLRRRLREVMFSLGAYEVMTYSFVSEAQIIGLGEEPKDYLKLQNPLSIEQAYLRRSPLPSLISALSRNTKHAADIALYEVTGVFEPQGQGELPAEPERLALIWQRKAESFTAVKGALDSLDQLLGLGLEVSPESDSRFATGRSARISLGSSVIGWIGQLTPALARRHKIRGEIAYLELDLQVLMSAARPVIYQSTSRFPEARRDLSVVVSEDVTWQSLKTEASRGGDAVISFLSDYRGDDLPKDHKAIALHLTMSAPDRTLTDAEVEDRLAKILSRLQRKFKAQPRD